MDPKRQKLISVFMERNSKINLSAIRNADDIYTKHILDALEIWNIAQRNELYIHYTTHQKQCFVCDLGTGGGFPLLPLAIKRPAYRYTGLDARKKKLWAINEMITELWLTNAKTFRSRAEEHTMKYDIVTARWVAHAEMLIPRVEKLLKKSGTAFLYKMYTRDEDAYIVERCTNNDRHYYRHKYMSEDGKDLIIYTMKRM